VLKTKTEVKIGDVVKMQCHDRHLTDKINKITLIKQGKLYKQRYIVSILKVIEEIEKIDKSLEIVNIGETDCVVEIKPPKKNQFIVETFKVILVSLILFFGAGFSIMAFNNDVSIFKLFEDVVAYTADGSKKALAAINLGYSVGLAAGIIIFYNHFGPKKITNDPTPIEVQMRTYENDIYTTLVDGHNRNDGRIDVK